MMTKATLRRRVLETEDNVVTTIPTTAPTIVPTTIAASASDVLSEEQQSTFISLRNFSMHLQPPVMETDRLIQSIEAYLQEGFLWDVQTVTWGEVQQVASSEASAWYFFGAGVLQLVDKVDTNPTELILQQEQVSLMKDTALLEHVLQQDFSDLKVLQVQFEGESAPPNDAMFSSALSMAQTLSLLILSALVLISIVAIVCLRRYWKIQSRKL
jgi:hypothetical protein